MISVTEFHQESGGYDESKNIRDHNGEPNAIDPKDHRKNQHWQSFKHQHSWKRNDCRDKAVVQRREECGTVNIETDEKKSQRIKAEAVAGQIQQIGVVAYKNAGQRPCKNPVSYTHLDVYKRQDWYRILLFNILILPHWHNAEKNTSAPVPSQESQPV